MSLELKIGRSSLGSAYRDENEDAIDVQEWSVATSCIVADSDNWDEHELGRFASEHGIGLIQKDLRRHLLSGTDKAKVPVILRNALTHANKELCAHSVRIGRGLGATIVVLLWTRGSEAYIASLGDSRAYRIRNRHLDQLTVDDTVAQALVATGRLNPADVADSPWRRILFKYLGCAEIGEGPEVQTIPVQPDDTLLLTSDGLHECVPSAEILQIACQGGEVQSRAEALCQRAVANGSRDDVSCILIDVIEK